MRVEDGIFEVNTEQTTRLSLLLVASKYKHQFIKCIASKAK